MHKALEVQVPQLLESAWRRHAYFFNRLEHVSQEYALLQIAKLHDPSVQQNRANLSLAYIVENGDWDGPTRAVLAEMKSRLDQLGREALGIARKRALCHSDLETILAGRAVGKFPLGLDQTYLQTLREFASMVHERVVGVIYVFGDEPTYDVESLIASLNEATRLGEIGPG
jgi:hypothetical protein